MVLIELKLCLCQCLETPFEANFLYAFEGQSFWRKSLHITDTGKTRKQVKQGEKRHRL